MGNCIATSIEQSKQLLEMGIDPNTASMWYNKWTFKSVSGYRLSVEAPVPDDAIPAWTLDDLISIFPDMIAIEGVKYLLEITKREIRYVRRIGGITGYRRLAIIGEDSNFTLIDIAVKAIVKLKKEGVI